MCFILWLLAGVKCFRNSPNYMNIAFITLFWHNAVGGKTAYQSPLPDPIKVGDLCTKTFLCCFSIIWEIKSCKVSLVNIYALLSCNDFFFPFHVVHCEEQNHCWFCLYYWQCDGSLVYWLTGFCLLKGTAYIL